MHGASTPFSTGWSGLGSYDMYQQAAQGLHPPAVLPPLPAAPHIPSRLPVAWMKPDMRVPTSMDAYLHMLHGMNGSMMEDPHNVSQASKLLPAFHPPSDNTNSGATLYSNINTDVYKQGSENLRLSELNKVKMKSTSSEPNYPGIGSSHNVSRDVHVPMSFMSPVPHEAAAYNTTHPSNTFSHLKWKNAYFRSSSSNCSTSSGVLSNMSTSAGPVASTSMASNGVIPYYSQPRQHDIYSMPNGLSTDAASKEAARIMEEAHFSNMRSGQMLSERKLASPFTNISNDFQRQQPSTFMTSEHIHRPASSLSTHSLDLKSPVDFRPENILHMARPQQPSLEPIQGDFWSQFGLPPPNIELNNTPQTADKKQTKRPVDFLGHSDGLIKPPKRTKPGEMFEREARVDDQETFVDKASTESLDDRKKPEKLTRRKSFTEDPVIDALVDAKVQEILAACKEKEDLKGSTDRYKPVKSPKHANQSSSLLKQETPCSSQSDHIPVYQMYKSQPSNAAVSSVYDFTEGGQNVNIQKKSPSHKGVSQKVMDMRYYEKDKLDHASEDIYNPFISAQKPNHEILNCAYDEMSEMRSTRKDYPEHCPLSFQDQINEMRQLKKKPKPSVIEFDGHDMKESSHVKNKICSFGQIPEIRNLNSSYIKSEPVNSKTSPCVDCFSVGKIFSEKCEMCKNQQKMLATNDGITEMKEDPFQFSDMSSGAGPGLMKVKKNLHVENKMNLNPYRSWTNERLKSEHERFVNNYEQMHANQKLNGDIKPNVHHLPENIPNVQHMDKYSDINMSSKKGIKMEKNVQKLKSVVPSKFEKPQGFNVAKKFANRPYGIKSSLALIKKSQKFYLGKVPAIRKKWRNNPNYKKRPKDDFAEKLMKNLGFPPLTLKDLVTKNHCQLPHGYTNGHSTIAASMLNAEDKAARRDTVPVVDDGTMPITDSSCVDRTIPSQADTSAGMPPSCVKSAISKLKHFRSKSVDQPSFGEDKKPFQRPRSCSLDMNSLESDVKLSVDKLKQKHMKTVSEQINDLRERLTGQKHILESNSLPDIPKCGCLGVDGKNVVELFIYSFCCLFT